ncbi:hypothetical protein ACFQ14_02530 [Pseudahrensia aquimaris]|uniref:Uncharacterized protein n=1 Tax=Pseudahrensia aquimaris TaxID=744461 RepID=A0ABW3FBL3_9HYPH
MPVLESGLFFALGFLASALLALMVAPAIWRRAVVLTRQKIESSVPLTLNEIQADKDQLRAEFAMSTRRLEVSLEDLKERAAEQLIEINRRRDEVLALEDEQEKRGERIAELQNQSEELRAELHDREEKLSETTFALRSLETQLEEKAASLEALDRRYKTVMSEFDDQKIELVARETRLDGVTDEVRELKNQVKSFRNEADAAREEAKASKIIAEREIRRAADLDEKISRLTSTMADMEARLERRDRDLAKLKERAGSDDKRASKAQGDASNLQEQNVKLKAELADAALRMESLMRDASGENVENAIATFETERRELRDRLKMAEAERDALKAELQGTQLASGEDWEVERRENAIIRERINDLAAKVTAMTAQLEGPDSPINEALALKGKRTDAGKSAQSEVNSLADRIRAIQQAAEKA